jgi:hypothetical protein
LGFEIGHRLDEPVGRTVKAAWSRLMSLFALKLFFHLMGGFGYRLCSDLFRPRFFRIIFLYRLMRALGLGVNLCLLRRAPFVCRRFFLMRRMPFGVLGHHLFGGSRRLNDLLWLSRLLVGGMFYVLLLLMAFGDGFLSSRGRLRDRLMFERGLLMDLRLRSGGDRFLDRHGFRVFALDFADCGLELFELALQHGFRRTRLHVLELPLHCAARTLVDLHPHLGRIFRQAVDCPPNNCNKIRHQYFLKKSGTLPNTRPR